jgi:hypothetical protein
MVYLIVGFALGMTARYSAEHGAWPWMIWAALILGVLISRLSIRVWRWARTVADMLLTLLERR